MRITFEEIKNNETIRTYIKKADESLRSLGFTEHSFAHVTKVGVVARDILLKLGLEFSDLKQKQDTSSTAKAVPLLPLEKA